MEFTDQQLKNFARYVRVQMGGRYKQNNSIVSRAVAGETVLVPIRQNVGALENI